MLNNPTLKWYKEVKLYIGYDSCYRNNRNSEYLKKARTNSLQLVEHLGRGKRNYDKTCKLCSQEEEDLEQFLVKYPMLQSKRDGEAMKKWKHLSTTKQTASLLFKNKE